MKKYRVPITIAVTVYLILVGCCFAWPLVGSEWHDPIFTFGVITLWFGVFAIVYTMAKAEGW